VEAEIIQIICGEYSCACFWRYEGLLITHLRSQEKDLVGLHLQIFHGFCLTLHCCFASLVLFQEREKH